MTDFLYLDLETTGLDPFIHEIVEASWALNDDEPRTIVLPHTLDMADPDALRINRYYERGLNDITKWANEDDLDELVAALEDAHIAGSNPGFDVSFLSASGYHGWYYRLMDVPLWVAGKLEWEESRGLAKTAQYFRDSGYDVPEPDHSAGGDVLTTRAIHKIARAL
jgi:DNA polymerase-3 subunit epsilon